MRKRYAQTLSFSLLFVFVLFSLSHGGTFIENKDQPLPFKNALAQRDFKYSQKIFRLTHASYLAYQSDSMKIEERTDVYGFKGKSVKKAFLYSLIVPGSGEFYAGSKIKAALFFGLDVTLWALYFNYHGKGKDEEKKYRAFADEHWSEDEYLRWLVTHLGIESDTATYWDPEKQEWTYLSHHLPDKKTDQYYEMIGKYEQFSWGWVDYDTTENFSLSRDSYLDMRRISNDWLNKAKYSAMISLANHILAAFDAAIAVNKYNKKGERFSQIEFKTRLVERDREIIPRLSMSVRF
jgi:hypothetical protein